MDQIKRQLEREKTQQHKGWWASGTFEIESARSKEGIDPDTWDAMSWDARTRVIALHRVLGTMEAWELHVARPKDK